MAAPQSTPPRVLSVTTSASHNFSKNAVSSIKLIANLGVEGDCHAGETVQHRSRLHIKPPPANLRQVHLMPMEVLRGICATLPTDEMKTQLLAPGALGQNITTEGVDLLSLGAGTEIRFVGDGVAAGYEAVIAITGLRNPCPQIDKFQAGLKDRFLVRDEERHIVRRLAGVMATVEKGGVVQPGMRLVIDKPPQNIPLDVV
jgi:MOSC domain-containing protein YiiM